MPLLPFCNMAPLGWATDFAAGVVAPIVALPDFVMICSVLTGFLTLENALLCSRNFAGIVIRTKKSDRISKPTSNTTLKFMVVIVAEPCELVGIRRGQVTKLNYVDTGEESL